MGRDVQDYVSDNTRRTRQIDTRFVELSRDRQRNLSFGNNTIDIAVSLEVYTRDLQNALISGHPNAEHGSGRGVSGDVRGSWTLQSSAAATATFTADGRTAVRDSLNGESAGSIDRGLIGSGSGDAAVGDTALESEHSSVAAYGVADAYNEVRSRADHRFNEHPLGSAEEYGVESQGGNLMCRLTESVSLTVEDEVRVDITFTVTGSGIGGQVVPEDGETAVRDSIRSPGETIGINEIAFGTGTTDFSKTDSGLTSEVYRKNALRSVANERIEAEVHITQNEPAGQPVDLGEIAVFDNQGNALMLATFDPFEKTDQFPFNARTIFRVV